ncbi:MAG TPA: CPBP family intramembrane glutamic endopeptidase [Pyrinomonadaceae bacterium]
MNAPDDTHKATTNSSAPARAARVAATDPGARASESSASAPDVSSPASESRALAAWEIVSIACSTLIAEWAVLALGSDKLWLSVPVACAFALMFYSHRLRGETLRELGWRTDNFVHAARLLLLPMVAGSVLLVLVGWLWFGGSFSFGQRRAGWAIFGFPVWGFAWGLLQQYVLQAYINRRAQIVFGKGAASITTVALLFALLHLPNPWLMCATFLGGLIWAAIYQRTPNLYALAISHAALTWVLISTLPSNALRGLRVGYKFFG